ncbi:MAG TPA: JAB domain-containing protein [Rhizorhapis sp.]|nr:JAB domain-containing protein [Rhizorhapis sp.]
MVLALLFEQLNGMSVLPSPNRINISTSPALDQRHSCGAEPIATGSSAFLETLSVLYVDAEGNIAKVHHSSNQRPDLIFLPARSIIEQALTHDYRRFILIHNHPSGDPRPSAADIVTTRLLCRTAAPLGLQLLDHIIVAGQCCFSFRAAGLI